MDKKKVVSIIGVLGAVGCGLFKFADYLYKNPAEYSGRWYESLSDDDLKSEREKTQNEWRTAGRGDMHRALELERRLNRFDKEWRKRNYTGQASWTRPPREHGYNLYKDDD